MEKKFSSFLGLRKIYSIFPWAVYDLTTDVGRSKERYRRIALSAVFSTLAKIIAVGTTLVFIPLTIKYLGGERYGMWMTMSSIIAMMGFADFGLGNGLLNAVSKSYGEDDKNNSLKNVSSAFFMLSAISFLMLTLFF